MKIPEQTLKDYSPGSPIYSKVWERIIAAGDQFNEPGRFTALIGYEWTSVPKGFNLHRNVILRDDGSRARLVVPLTTQPPIGSTEPLYEVTQIKGDGEAHPALSPTDEFADYETWEVGNLDITELKKPDMLQREYAREAIFGAMERKET